MSSLIFLFVLRLYLLLLLSKDAKEGIGCNFHRSLYSYFALIFIIASLQRRERRYQMRDNGDDGVLEVRRGTIVKQVMPYIASNSTSRRLDEAYGALSLGQYDALYRVA